MQPKVIGGIEVQGARAVVGDGHARLAYVGVRPVDVDLAVSCSLHDGVVDCSLAHAGLAFKMHTVVPAVENEVNRFCKVDCATVKFYFCHDDVLI